MPNMWKDLQTGENPPEEIDVVVEIVKGSRNKLELDKKNGTMRLDRVLHKPFEYKWDYGFIPQTLSDDGDPADGLIIMDQPTFPGVVVPARPIGIMHMIDGGEQDDKLICVAAKDPDSKGVKDISDLPKKALDEMKFFFSNYKKKEGKTTSVSGFEDATVAKRYIKDAIELYKKKSKGN